MLRTVLRILSVLGFIASIYWWYKAPEKEEPVVGIIAALVAFLTSFVNENKEMQRFQRNQSLMKEVRARIYKELGNISKQVHGDKTYSSAADQKAVEVYSWELLESDIQRLVEKRILTFRSKKLCPGNFIYTFHPIVFQISQSFFFSFRSDHIVEINCFS